MQELNTQFICSQNRQVFCRTGQADPFHQKALVARSLYYFMARLEVLGRKDISSLGKGGPQSQRSIIPKGTFTDWRRSFATPTPCLAGANSLRLLVGSYARRGWLHIDRRRMMLL